MMVQIDTLETQVATLTEQVKTLSQTVQELSASQDKYHREFGVAQVSDYNVDTDIRASGSITMETNGQEYELGTGFNPKEVIFYGIVINASLQVRSFVTGNAQLGKSLYFQPLNDHAVTVGGPTQDIIQSSAAFTVDRSDLTNIKNTTTVSEGHIVSVGYPTNSTIVARATISRYEQGKVFITATLASGYSIVGNFVLK
jgi:hypothetical protein